MTRDNGKVSFSPPFRAPHVTLATPRRQGESFPWRGPENAFAGLGESWLAGRVGTIRARKSARDSFRRWDAPIRELFARERQRRANNACIALSSVRTRDRNRIATLYDSVVRISARDSKRITFPRWITDGILLILNRHPHARISICF